MLQPALSAIERAVSELSERSDEPSGLIRLNSSRIAARLLIEPHLGEFLSRYPKVRLELVMNDGLSNIVADGMDAGLRLGKAWTSTWWQCRSRRRLKWPWWARLLILRSTGCLKPRLT